MIRANTRRKVTGIVPGIFRGGFPDRTSTGHIPVSTIPTTLSHSEFSSLDMLDWEPCKNLGTVIKHQGAS